MEKDTTQEVPVAHPSEIKVNKLKDGNSHHVLIALDGSPESQYAFDWALKYFINPQKHVLYLLTVAKVNPKASMIYSAGIGAGGIPWNLIEEENKESINESKKIVLHYHHLLKEAFPNQIEVHSLVGQGDARDEIVDAIEKVKADVLIVGNRGIGVLKRAFLGSTSDYCLRHANCTVIVAKVPKKD